MTVPDAPGADTPAHSPLPGDDATIVALSTPPGRGAIALVRLSGRDAFRIAEGAVRPWPRDARVATRARVHDAAGATIDEAVVTRFVGPRSFTGEDVVEIACHGGLAAPAAVLAALIALGARPAAPGEFTRRAVLAGRIDLLQAEAIGDLIDARSQRARRAAVDQLDGGLSRRVGALRDRLLGLEALIAYDIDFPEEDDGPVDRERIAAAAERLLADLDALLATSRAGELVREGALVVIAGAPNAGKSSLFNALLGRRRAIVTSVPGTTRDALEAVLDAGRWPIRLVDTAGLRETTDVVERLGVEVSEEYLERADVVLACGDTDEGLAVAASVVQGLTEAPAILVRTKEDQTTDDGPQTTDDGRQTTDDGPQTTDDGRRTTDEGRQTSDDGHETPDDGRSEGTGRKGEAVRTSAETGAGLAALIARVEQVLDARVGVPAPDMPMLTHARHAHAIGQARDEVRAFHAAWAGDVLPAPVAAVHLREAVHVLEELVGAVDVEDVLGRVFSTFCVGK